MVRINLLPANMLRERGRQRAQKRFLLLMGLIIILLSGCFGFLYMNTLEVGGRLAALTAERVIVEAEVGRYEVYTKMQSDVNLRRDMLKGAMGSPLLWVEVLEDIGTVIPPNVWLTDLLLSQDVDPEGSFGQLTLRGVTYDHPSTSRWVTALREVGGVIDARVMHSSEETIQDDELVRFELRAVVLPGAEFDPLTGRGE